MKLILMFDPINAPYSRNCFHQMMTLHIHIYTICSTSVKYMPNCNQNLFQTLQKLQKRYIANLQKNQSNLVVLIEAFL